MSNPYCLLVCDDDDALREALTEQIDAYDEFHRDHAGGQDDFIAARRSE
jgi:hypothetical protein